MFRGLIFYHLQNLQHTRDRLPRFPFLYLKQYRLQTHQSRSFADLRSSTRLCRESFHPKNHLSNSCRQPSQIYPCHSFCFQKTRQQIYYHRLPMFRFRCRVEYHPAISPRICSLVNSRIPRFHSLSHASTLRRRQCHLRAQVYHDRIFGRFPSILRRLAHLHKPLFRGLDLKMVLCFAFNLDTNLCPLFVCEHKSGFS